MKRSTRSLNGGFTPNVTPTPDKPGRLTNQLLFLEESVINSLMDDADAWPFNKPVDPVKLNLADYDLVVSKPMDLGTVKKRLQNQFYWSGAECIDDIKRIFKNCYEYNQPGNDVVKMAKNLETLFLSLIKKLPHIEEEVAIMDAGKTKEDHPVPKPVSNPSQYSGKMKAETRKQNVERVLKKAAAVKGALTVKSVIEKKVTYADKMRVYDKIQKLGSDELKGVVDIIRPRSKFPGHSQRYLEIDVNLEDMPVSMFRELEAYVNEKVAGKLGDPVYKVIPPKAVTEVELLMERDNLEKKLKEVNAKLEKLQKK